MVTVDIIRTLSAYRFDVTVEQMLGKSKLRRAVHARQMVMYLVKKHRHCSLKECAEAAGRKDHTTALSNIRAVQKRVDEDERWADMVRSIEQGFETK